MIANTVRIYLLCVAACLAFSCKSNTQFGAAENKLVKDSVTQLTANIEKDISAKGPAAWLDYFENSTDFFMASQGQLAFDSRKAASEFIQNTLVKSIPHIKLKWTNVKIDPLSPDIAAVGAYFHEELTDASNKTQLFDGYFTG